jgi:rifampicin phosphotransferase
MTTSTFTPPSPGAWELEQTHLTRPPSMFSAAVMPDAMMAGFKEGTRTYGLLLDHLEVAVINRFYYFAPRAVGAPKSAKGPPPRLVFAIMRRVHPEIRRRVRLADSVFRDRVWRRDVEKWDRELRPTMAEQGRALIADDPARMSDADLADHVRRAADLLRTSVFIHHRLNFCALLPVGDFLISAMEWTGMSPGELLQTMRGLSPVSAGALDELTELRRALVETPDALTVVRSGGSDAGVLEQLLARTDRVGAAARAYLDVVGLRILGGYDVADRHAREHPELIMRVIRASLEGEDARRRDAAAQSLARIRERVPERHREEFDVMLAEAQSVYRVRDERVFHGDMMASGIARRAILAAGDRLVAQGRALHPEDLVDATPDEIVALLQGRPGPSAEELAERARWRRDTPISVAPHNLGFAPSPPPPPEWLPRAAGRLQQITALVMSLLFDVHKSKVQGVQEVQEVQGGQEVQEAPLKGFAVSSGVYEGPVRVIRDVEELPLVQKGEVLVAPSTGSAFNVVLPLIGALVTERGGVLSHAAIVSREYGLPGIVGCVGAATKLKTGTRVRVDGDKGEVWTIA